MANDLSSNVTRKLLRSFMKGAEASRVLSKSIDRSVFEGKFTPASGSTVDVKRPHDYNSIETSGGDISSSTKSDILSGKATATVQDYITVATEYSNVEEALHLDQLDEILAPMATRMITTLELNLGEYMQKNSNLSVGAPGTAVDAWSDVSAAAALMRASGVPDDGQWSYVMNDHTQVSLADAQNGLYAADDRVRTAWDRATINPNFAGMRVMASNCLKSRTSTNSGGDRAGAVNGAPTATYVGHKDTMIQSIVVDGFTGNFTVKAGDVIEITGPNRISLGSREVILDGTGSAIPFRAVVAADATITSGAGTITIAGPAIYEANGQYNTVDAAIADNDVITLLGADNTVYQPNLFFHKQAFSLSTVKLPKLNGWDTTGTTSDGFSIRCTKYSDGDANKQMVRFDLLPAFACLNPFYAGHGYGS